MPRKGKKSKSNVKHEERTLFDQTPTCLKCNRSVFLDQNFERWCELRSKCSFSSDEEFTRYLLDLLESGIKSDKTDDLLNKKVSGCIEIQSAPKLRANVKTQPSIPQTTKKINSKTFRNPSASLCSSELDAESEKIKYDSGESAHKMNDEEKENVRLDGNTNTGNFAPVEDDTRVKNKIELASSEHSKQIVNTISTENSIILKDNERNQDYTKVKKHKERKNSNGVVNFSLDNFKNCKNKRSTSMEKGSKNENDTSERCLDVLTEEPEPIRSFDKCEREIFVSHQGEEVEEEEKEKEEDEDRQNDDVQVEATTEDDSISKTQRIPRMAITITLCSDCDSRHVQNSCPLRCPQKIVHDSVSWEEYSQETSSRESREEDDSYSQSRGQSFAFLSLPNCLQLRVADPEHGLSVFASQPLPAFTRFGPLIGRPVKQMEIPDDFSMKGIWEVEEEGRSEYLSTQSAETSSWMRWLRPAASREQRNLAAVQLQLEQGDGNGLYFVTTDALSEGDELLYWTDPNHAWASKKITKTNCGGCNLQFAHPIYYHRHCAIFHDPNFSLTIRKYHCKICGLSVLGKENIMKHAATNHDGKGAYQCQYCKKFFLRLNYLEMHRTYGCSLNPHRTRPLCDYCGRKFCQPQKLKIHIKRMHSEISEVLKEFQCKRCLKILGSRAALQRHIKEVHHKAILCSCTCDKCGKMFQNKSNLKIHMLTHSGIKPFKCQQNGCSAAFTTKQCLQLHYKKVHGYADSKMPTIERSVAYTFDAYAGEGERGSTNARAVDDSGCSSPDDDRLAIDDGEIDEQHVEIEQPDEYQQYSSPLSVGEQEDMTGYDERLEHCEDRDDWAEEAVASPDSSSQAREQEQDFYRFGGEDRSNELAKSSHPVLAGAPKPESSNASLLVEAALDAAEKDIEMSSFRANKMSPDPLFPMLHANIQRMSPPPSHRELLTKSSDYSIPHPDLSASARDQSQYACSTSPALRPLPGYSLMLPERLPPHFELHLSPTLAPIESYHVPHDETRYDTQQQLQLQRRPDDYSSSDDNDNAVQNLSIGLKNKSLQLDLHSGYKYDAVEERNDTFECVEGVDMSRSGIYHHAGFVSRYPHALYEQRSYTHSDVLRVVNASITHSIDLSLSRGANHHHMMEALRPASPPPIPYQNYPSPPPATPYLATSTARASHSPNIAMYHHFSSY